MYIKMHFRHLFPNVKLYLFFCFSFHNCSFYLSVVGYGYFILKCTIYIENNMQLEIGLVGQYVTWLLFFFFWLVIWPDSIYPQPEIEPKPAVDVRPSTQPFPATIPTPQTWPNQLKFKNKIKKKQREQLQVWNPLNSQMPQNFKTINL